MSASAHDIWKMIFWLCLASAVYTYFLYPLLLMLLARLFQRRHRRKMSSISLYQLDDRLLPTVTLVFSAYNEADVLPEDIEVADPTDQGGFSFLNQIDFGAVLMWSALSFVTVLAIILLWFWIDPVSRVTTVGRVIGGMKRVGIQPPTVLQQVYQFELTPTGKTYSRWSVWLRRLGFSLNLFQTPNERAEAFGSSLPLAANLGWKIVDTYVGERFGGENVEVDELKVTWREIRPFLWIEWIRKIVGIKRKVELSQEPKLSQSSV